MTTRLSSLESGVLVVSRGARRRARIMRAVWAVIDAVVWVIAIYATTYLRLDSSLGHFASGLALAGAIAFTSHMVIGHLIGPYAIDHVRASFDEVRDLTIAVTITAIGLFAWSVLQTGVMPRGTGPTAGAMALIAMLGLRFVVRTFRARSSKGRRAARRALIFGAGEAGRRLVHSLIYDDSNGIIPLAFLDDDRSKQRLRIEGFRVRGRRQDLAPVAERLGADTLIVALPSADSTLLRELACLADDAGLELLVLPPLREIMGGKPTTNDLRSLDVTDLLGRKPVQLDTRRIAEHLAGKRVLVTGAGGSIGSELCRQVAAFQPAKLYLLDRDESGLQATQLSLTGSGLLDTDDVLLANIRERQDLLRVFERIRPEIVFHAAALKHLPLLERFPLEAWKTNVIGTRNVLEAAASVGVEIFVNISTDKAADPTSVLGYSKRLAERLTADFALHHHGRYVSVRFGNVLGSRGSVIHVFREQIERGGPVTVTHPEVKRYFMLIPEACQLVLEAASIGRDGDVMVLEMGEQVRIVDLAETMVRMSGRADVDIQFSGLRDGEKLGEDLFADAEGRRKTEHPLVDSVDVPALSPHQLPERQFDHSAAAETYMRTHALTRSLGRELSRA